MSSLGKPSSSLNWFYKKEAFKIQACLKECLKIFIFKSNYYKLAIVNFINILIIIFTNGFVQKNSFELSYWN